MSDLLPRNCSREYLLSLHICLLRAACFNIYSSYSSMILFSSEIFVVLLLWWRHLLVTLLTAIVFKRCDQWSRIGIHRVTELAHSRAAGFSYRIRHVFIVIQCILSHSSLNHNQNMPYPV